MGQNGWRQQILQHGGIVDGPPDSMELQVSYPGGGPSLTIDTYYQSVFGVTGNLDAFMGECRLQRKSYWRDQLTGLVAVRHFQAGFNMPFPLP